jgi:hypothetical protein
LGYTFDDRRLNLTINEATLQTPDNKVSAIALFNGNFDYDVATTIAPAAHTQRIKQIVSNWQRDLELYKEVVGQFMLTDSIISFPSLV